MKNLDEQYTLHAIGHVRSTLRALAEAPKQGYEGAPDAWIEISPAYGMGLLDIVPGDHVFVITWLHMANRALLRVHPRDNRELQPAGVFATRSPNRPNPLGLHRVVVREVSGCRLRVGPMEVVDGTPVVDIKPVLDHDGGA